MFIFGKKVSGNDAVKGLMFQRKPMYNNYGMLFDMGEKYNSMWMKNTYIPLDVIFLDKNMNIIGYKENNTPHSLKSISINKPSKYVLEMNAGSVNKFNLEIGDKIYFINYKWGYIFILLLIISIYLKYIK